MHMDSVCAGERTTPPGSVAAEIKHSVPTHSRGGTESTSVGASNPASGAALTKMLSDQRGARPGCTHLKPR